MARNKGKAAEAGAPEEAAAEGAQGSAGGAAAAKTGPLGLLKNKKVLMFGLPALILALGGAGAAILFLGGGGEAEHSVALEEETHDQTEAIAQASAHVPHFYEMPELLVNINSSSGEATFLKIKLNIEVSDEALMPILDQNMPRVIDRYQGFLRELRPEDISGSAGYYRLKLELLRRVNLAIAPAQADAVNIDQLLIQ